MATTIVFRMLDANTMFQRTVVLLLLMLPFSAFSQNNRQAPDVAAIKKDVADASSPMYYPKLMDRFKRGDTTLTIAEKRHLYFGYAGQADFSPYGISDFGDSIRSIIQYETLTEPDYIRLLSFTDSVLAKRPQDLQTLSYRVFAAKKLERENVAMIARAQLHTIVDALLSTGDGKTIATAFWVTEVSHEYFLLSVLDLQYGGSQSLVDGPCDYLTLKENDKGLQGLYFNVSISMGALDEMFGDAVKKKRKRRK